MLIDHVLAAVAVADIDASKLWYERLFGRPPDEVPMREAAEWRLSDGGWLQLVEDSQRAGGSMVTLSVTHIDSLVSDLAQRDVTLETDLTPSGAFRLGRIADPDGNLITFAEDQWPDAERRAAHRDRGGAPTDAWIEAP